MRMSVRSGRSLGALIYRLTCIMMKALKRNERLLMASTLSSASWALDMELCAVWKGAHWSQAGAVALVVMHTACWASLGTWPPLACQKLEYS